MTSRVQQETKTPRTSRPKTATTTPRPSRAERPTRKAANAPPAHAPRTASEQSTRVSRPKLEPRLQERRVAVARSNGRVRLKRIAVVALALGMSIGVLVVLHSSLFGARAITVRGAAHTGERAVLATSGLASHPPLIDINAAAMQARLLSLPWVKHATVRLHWPDGVAVIITERTPVAYAQLGRASYALFDANARVLAVTVTMPHGLVHTHLSTTRVFPGDNLLASNRAVVALASSVPTSLISRIAMVRDDSDLGLVVQLQTHANIVFGSATNVREKFVSLATLLANDAISHMKSVDLRVPAAPVLTP